MQALLSLETNKYNVKIENFEGPLDLLCHLIDKNKMNICDIKISDITDQYIQYLNEMENLNLEIASEFLVMASTLLYLKSKTLLPKEVEEEKELTEEELIRRIIEYKKYKEITNKLKSMYQENSKIFFKSPEVIQLPKQVLDVSYNKEVIINEYKKIIENNAKRLNKNAKNIEKIAITETYTVESKLRVMFKELIRKKNFIFNNLFSISKCNKKEVVTAFTGLLELSRRSKVTTYQQQTFGDIQVVKKNKSEH